MASSGGRSGLGGSVSSGGRVGVVLGCSTDLDCKGARVCENGKCVTPSSGGAQGAGGLGSAGADAGEIGSGGTNAACYAPACSNSCSTGWHHCCAGTLCACCQPVGTGGATGSGGASDGGQTSAAGGTGTAPEAGLPTCGPGNGTCSADQVCTVVSGQSVFSCYTKGYAGSCDPTKPIPPGAICDGYCQTSPLTGCRGSYYSCSPLFDLATGKQCPLCADGHGMWQCGPP
jgi:hypothetical protein